MGRGIKKEHFTASDHEAFAGRLRAGLEELRSMLAEPGFGRHGPATIGAELEVHLVDATGRAASVNQAVLDGLRDERVTHELARYNLEINSRPYALTGRAFAGLGAELDEVLGRMRGVARLHGAQPVPIGILPTLERRHFTRRQLTNARRYRALEKAIGTLAGGDPHVQIEDVDLEADGIAVAGANTSFQVHLRVAPDAFARTYNAAQLVTAPALAVAANSPLFLDRVLWDETRVALFSEVFGAGDRVSLGSGWCVGGIAELFEGFVARHEPILPEVGARPLDDLRLHAGTIWVWNRPVIDDDHVRIELRAMPSGPTVTDMMANAAFTVGATLALAPTMEEVAARLDFEAVEANFWRAAREGLRARFTWPGRDGEVDAKELVGELVPLARRALLDAGATADEIDPLLAIVDARAATGRTGATWQRAFHEDQVTRLHPRAASHAVVETYAALAARGEPVHTWPWS